MARDLAAVNELDSIELENTGNNTNSAVSNEVNRRRYAFIFYLLLLFSLKGFIISILWRFIVDFMLSQSCLICDLCVLFIHRNGIYSGSQGNVIRVGLVRTIQIQRQCKIFLTFNLFVCLFIYVYYRHFYTFSRLKYSLIFVVQSQKGPSLVQCDQIDVVIAFGIINSSQSTSRLIVIF